MKNVARPVIERLPSVAVWTLQKLGGLAPGQLTICGPLTFTAFHDHADVNGRRIDYRYTHEPYRRYLRFACPDCGRACGHLYSLDGGPVSCRICINGTFASDNVRTRGRKAVCRARGIRLRLAKLTGTPFELNASTMPPKTGPTNRRIYDRLAANHDELIERAKVGYAKKHGIPYERPTPPRPLIPSQGYERGRKAARKAEQNAAVEAARMATVEAEIIAREKSERAIIDQQRERARRPQYPIDPRT